MSKPVFLIVSFNSEYAAIAFQRHAKKSKLPGRLIATPGYITAGCGYAWRAGLEDKAAIQQMLEETKIEADLHE